jgi:hypothetical protein
MLWGNCTGRESGQGTITKPEKLYPESTDALDELFPQFIRLRKNSSHNLQLISTVWTCVQPPRDEVLYPEGVILNYSLFIRFSSYDCV